MKMNFQPNRIVSLVFFCKNIEKKHYPPVYIVDTIQKMCMSLSTLEHIDLANVEIIIFLPGLMFKMYLQFIKIYLPAKLNKNMVIYETYEEINQHFYLDIDDDIEQRIRSQLGLNINKYGEIMQIKLMKEVNKFKENYFE